MAPTTGIRLVHRRLLDETLANDGKEAHDRLVEELTEDWEKESEPWEAAAHTYLDDVIDPRRTREALAEGIDFAWGSTLRISSKR